MKFCKDCKHLSGTSAPDGACSAPQGIAHANRVTGEAPSASWMRGDAYPSTIEGQKDPPRCGRDAKWFEPRDGVAS